ncbi:MAG: SpoIIE family protein phosphatase [Methanobacteriaceae archaeon]|nr:SpoIIE family protein phosphatase [Methanobacteriaceae archaeon]
MKNSANIISGIKRLFIYSVITFLSTLPFHYLFQIISASELLPASPLPPILGLMFGPLGALGAAIGNLAVYITAHHPPEIIIMGFLAQFLYAYIPYKLWYTLDIGENNGFPRLDNVKNLMKFVIIIFINAFIMSGLFGFLMLGWGIDNFDSFTTIIFVFNNFDFSIIIGTLIIVAANFYGISMYKPQKTKKTLLSPRIFDGMLLSAIIIVIVYGIYSVNAGIDNWGIISGIIFYLLVIAYVFKPVTKEVKDKKPNIKISLTEKLILIFVITGAIIAIVTGIRSFFTISEIGGDALEFWHAVYLNTTLILVIFYTSSIGFLWYIEKNITTPIESISNILNKYVSNSNKIENSEDIIFKCEEYANPESEVGILAISFQKMIGDLESYIKNLEKVTAEKERINTELNVAHKIQSDMLPRNFPERKEFEVYATNIPAKEVGGDFYDFFMIDKNRLAIVIGDVSGKGVPAALFMVIAKTLIKNHAQLGKSPAEIFNTVNYQLYDGNDENMFVTAWMGILEINTGKFTYVNAGHNPPLIKHGNKYYDWFKCRAGFVLGGMDNIKYTQNEITLDYGDRVCLYTDGITEAINSNEELFGDSRFLKIMNNTNNLSIKEIVSYVKGEIDSFVKDEEQFDDITMLIMEYKK